MAVRWLIQFQSELGTARHSTLLDFMLGIAISQRPYRRRDWCQQAMLSSPTLNPMVLIAMIPGRIFGRAAAMILSISAWCRMRRGRMYGRLLGLFLLSFIVLFVVMMLILLKTCPTASGAYRVIVGAAGALARVA